MALRRPRNRPARSGPNREPHDRVLIVCEGKRTEPLYFLEIADRYRLSTANIKVIGNGADPRTVVRADRKERDREKRRGEKYDRVYCVFDRDEHATFQTACDEARASRLRLTTSWRASNSGSCFTSTSRVSHMGDREAGARPRTVQAKCETSSHVTPRPHAECSSNSKIDWRRPRRVPLVHWTTPGQPARSTHPPGSTNSSTL